MQGYSRSTDDLIASTNASISEPTIGIDSGLPDPIESMDVAARSPCDGYDAERYIWIYVGYPILVMGTIGHLLTIVVLVYAACAVTKRTASRCDTVGQRLERRQLLPPLAICLLPMSFVGLATLYSGLLPRLLLVQTCGSVMLLRAVSDDLSCRLIRMLEYYSMQLYSWLSVCTVLEHTSTLLRPLACWRRLTSSFGCCNSGIPCVQAATIGAVCTCAIGLAALNALLFAAFGVTENGECEVVDVHLMNAYAYVDSVVYSLLPLTVMTLCNVLLASRLFAGCRWRRALLPDGEMPPTCGSAAKRARLLFVASICLNVSLLLTLAKVATDLSPHGGDDDNMVAPLNSSVNASDVEDYAESPDLFQHAPGEEQPLQQPAEADFRVIVWSLGMLASYAFCSGSFYVYLAVGVAFRQTAKQLLQAATPVSMHGRRSSRSTEAIDSSAATVLLTRPLSITRETTFSHANVNGPATSREETSD